VCESLSHPGRGNGLAVTYVFQFGAVFASFPALLSGALLTVELSAGAMVLGLALAVGCAFAKTSGKRWLDWLVSLYVEVIRNTPFLVQLFIIYFALPQLGLRLDADEAALLAMVVNLGAYASEIVRAGIEAVPHGEIEAGRALGLTRLQIFRFIVLFPAVKTVFPALASQFILLMLGSSVVAAISTEELTGIANSLQSRTFRSFETYFVVTAMYLVMALGFRAALAGLYWMIFRRGRPA
jgi:polar amino acid transport system permease protein